ncbi:transcriptional regulator, DeoR family [Roseateles sp. YR242]|uniref:DeoR/GlpR family DNA-binding transcription regulator n=1 Tax=Roseateles sp. YR242 TaxID=1855305 RepID=UPI0008C5C867|nr:DeoR/GlpR family DNA-binding transcription regulator [Roseateles sp. YR242]SEL23392.1 transcriptional regulator, DeoR family [Roseateles sp. YR242]
MSQPDLPRARRDLIAERLAAGQAVVAADLAAEFALSEDAIRRDLRALAADGRCRRVYGGAIPIPSHDRPITARLQEDPERKTALARAGANTVQRGELLFLDSGSTNVTLVDLLPEDADLTVATNGVDVAAAALRRQDLRLLLIGGEVDPHLGGSVDAAATASLSRMRIDRCFVGVCGLTVEDGAMATHFNEVVFKRTLVERSRHRVAMIASDKLHSSVHYQFAELNAFHTLVIEHDADPARVRPLREAGVQIIQAEAF